MRAEMKRIATVCAMLGLAACAQRELGSAPTASSALPIASSIPAPAASASASAPTSIDAPAKAFVETALGVLKSCTIHQDEIEMLGYEESDQCNKMDPADVAELRKRGDALAAASAQATTLPPLARTFVDEAKMYRAWIDLVQTSKDSRGTAALYQRLARVWNSWRPDAKVEVDPQSLVMDLFGVDESRIEHMTFYLKNAHGSGKALYEKWRAAGSTLTWSRGVNGPYIDERGWAIAPGW